jgi:hypothetical protein
VSAVVRDWLGPERQTRAGYQDVKECRRRHPLDLAQSSIELLGVSGPIEYRGWGKLDELMTASLMSWRYLINLHLFGPLRAARIGVI